MHFIDTHTHIDGEEFKDDMDSVILRAKESGALSLLIPGINLSNIDTISAVVNRYPGYCYGMIGLHPEDVREDYRHVITQMQSWLKETKSPSSINSHPSTFKPVAIGEIGLDYYWSREFEKEQLDAFEIQVRWALEEDLPLMIHCRKAQNEMVSILREIENGKWRIENSSLTNSSPLRGVFHCFTGNEHEAEELLSFPGFYLGIGGVLTFKKSKLPETLAAAVPLERIVLETDSPYMAPVPHRGERNESSFIPFIISKLAETYGVTEEKVAETTTHNACKLFNIVSIN